MQVFASCVVFLPLAIYLLVLGWINLRPWPLVVSGARETAALGLALAGPVLIGPGQLLLPPAATQHFGAWIWPLLALLYALAVLLAILISRPRLVIFNIDPAELRVVLTSLATELDAGAHWAGDTLALDGLGVELRIEAFASMSNVSLIAGGEPQSAAGWHHLERSLRSALTGARSRRNGRGAALIALAALMLFWLAYRVAENPAQTVAGLLNLLEP
jgi:hypothetical protein